MLFGLPEWKFDLLIIDDGLILKIKILVLGVQMKQNVQQVLLVWQAIHLKS
jgi:hypothetical protein